VALAAQTGPAFTWIDATGTLQSRQEILDAFAAGNAPRLVVLTTAVGVQLTTRVLRTTSYVNRDGRYQMAVSYHTSIASVPGFALAKQLPAK